MTTNQSVFTSHFCPRSVPMLDAIRTVSTRYFIAALLSPFYSFPPFPSSLPAKCPRGTERAVRPNHVPYSLRPKFAVTVSMLGAGSTTGYFGGILCRPKKINRGSKSVGQEKRAAREGDQRGQQGGRTVPDKDLQHPKACPVTPCLPPPGKSITFRACRWRARPTRGLICA